MSESERAYPRLIRSYYIPNAIPVTMTLLNVNRDVLETSTDIGITISQLWCSTMSLKVAMLSETFLEYQMIYQDRHIIPVSFHEITKHHYITREVPGTSTDIGITISQVFHEVGKCGARRNLSRTSHEIAIIVPKLFCWMIDIIEHFEWFHFLNLYSPSPVDVGSLNIYHICLYFKFKISRHLKLLTCYFLFIFLTACCGPQNWKISSNPEDWGGWTERDK